MGKRNIPLFSRKHTKAAPALPVFAAVLLLSAAAGCTDKEAPEAEYERGESGGREAEHDRYRWYGWENAELTALSGPAAETGTDWKLWTDQVRGTRLLYVNGSAYCAVNTLGILELRDIFLTGPAPGMTEIYNKKIFGNRTADGFFEYGAKLYVRLYYNTVLHDGPPPAPSIALVSFAPENKEIRVIPFSLQDEEEGWELVSLYPFCREEGAWLMAWKLSGTEKTEFRYVMLDVSAWTEKEIEEEQFLAEITPAHGVHAPVEVQRLLRTAKGHKGDTVYDITVSYDRPKYPQVFRFGEISMIEEQESDLVRLRCFSFGETYFLLLPEGRIFWVRGDGEKGELRLPELPEGYVYTDFITDGNAVLALWEEQDFASVRNAGFVYAPGT
jgi:hypothetical protein